MGPQKPKPRFTVDQYLARERAAQERSFYFDGEIFNMAGETLPHGTISVNLVGSLGTQLRSTHCRVLTKGMKVRSSPIPTTGKSMAGMFSYPDVLVVCGEPEFHDNHRDIILNPRAVLEVLSDSTEAFDRGKKFERYRSYNPSLTDYLLISPDQPLIEHFTRQEDGSWSFRFHKGLEEVVPIPSIGCVLRLAEIYDRVRFPDADPE